MSKNQTSTNLDLLTRSIDLTTVTLRGARLDLVSIVQDAATKAGTDLIKWLAREQITEQSFIFTMKHGSSIAHPNETGLKVLQKLEQTSSRLYGLHLILPGALGRTILYDEHLKWIGTTEAVLLKYHPMEYVVDTLCKLFIVHNMDEEDSKADATESVIRPVLEKAVDSIHLHVTNMGFWTEPSCNSLDHLTRHYIDPENLAFMIQEFSDSSDCDLMLRMDCYIVEIIDWILAHWSGRLEICINNEIVFHETLGISSYLLTAVIDNTCTVLGECAPGTHDQNFFIGKRISQADKGPEIGYYGILCVGERATEIDVYSSHRSSLYDIQNPFKTHHLYLDSREQKAAERAGQEVVKCILDLPVTSGQGTLASAEKRPSRCMILGLRVDHKSETNYRWWLKKVPSIVQKNLGSTTPLRSLFSSKHAVRDDTDSGYRRYEYSITEIADWYPEIRALMEMAYDRCACGCNDEDFKTLLALHSELNHGCRVNLIYFEVLLQIGHAMADGAGARDISNLRGRDSAFDLAEGVKGFLCCIAPYGQIYWNNWFRLCSSAVTGLSYDMASKHSIDDGKSGGLMFAVAGSITVTPNWFELEKEINLMGSWGIKQLNGSIQGLESEKALIDVLVTNGATKEITPSPISLVSGGRDADEVHVDSVVFHIKAELHRIATIARTKSVLRVISPITIYKAIMEAAQPKCFHNALEEVMVCPWTLNDIILGGTAMTQPETEFPHIALVANSFLNQNIVLGIVKECVLQRGNCCFPCLAKKAGTLKTMGICGTSKSLKHLTMA